ncbi:hypothetical protein JB92DRAFT_1976084 [Gautieria morchelliformis]|nr:hypothetical protein JB92DRAFT_1976084 [Gautieria morchelliformis]
MPTPRTWNAKLIARFMIFMGPAMRGCTQVVLRVRVDGCGAPPGRASYVSSCVIVSVGAVEREGGRGLGERGAEEVQPDGREHDCGRQRGRVSTVRGGRDAHSTPHRSCEPRAELLPHAPPAAPCSRSRARSPRTRTMSPPTRSLEKTKTRLSGEAEDLARDAERGRAELRAMEKEERKSGRRPC